MQSDPHSETHPLSRDECAAVSRYVGRLRKELQELSALFGKRYGHDHTMTDLAGRALVSMTLVEQELRREQAHFYGREPESSLDERQEDFSTLRAVHQH